MKHDATSLNVPVHIPLPAIASSRGARIVSTLRVHHGRWELNRDQLVFFAFARWLNALGLIGALLMRFASGKRALELELKLIATVTRGKYGLSNRVMDVKMVDGTVHRIIVDDFEDFAASLNDAMWGRGVALAA